VHACRAQEPEHEVELLNIICLSPHRWGLKATACQCQTPEVKSRSTKKKTSHLSSTICDSSMPTTHGTHAGSTHPGPNQENLTGQGRPPRGQTATAVRQALQNRVNEQEAELQKLKGAKSLKCYIHLPDYL